VLDDETLAQIERALLADFDHRFGGFGGGGKFPHPDVLDYALMCHVERRDARLAEILSKTLGAQVGGGLHDAVEGGFFRCCAERDWTRPVTEKTLDGNVGLARVLMGAGRHLDRPDLAACGRRTLGFVLSALPDETSGLLRAGLGPDDAYYALDLAARRTRTPPRPDGRLLAEANARAVVALARGAVLMDEPELAVRAHALMQSLLQRLWQPGKGMAHVLDASGPRDGDHLADMAECAYALLVVHEQSGDARLLQPLGDLLDGMLARHVMPSGDLGDRSGDGRVGSGLRWSAVAAQSLLRAAWLLQRPELTRAARRVLALHAGDFRRHGDAMAAFGRALAMALRPPVRVVILGAAHEPAVAALRERACTLPIVDRVVLPLEPGSDDARRDAPELRGLSPGHARVLLPEATVGDAATADELSRLLKTAVEARHAAASLSVRADEAG